MSFFKSKTENISNNTQEIEVETVVERVIEDDLNVFLSQSKYSITEPIYDVNRHKVKQKKPREDIPEELHLNLVSPDSIGQEPWRQDELIHQNLFEDSFAKNIIKTHSSRCYFCGFYDLHFLEIHHLDGNHYNSNANNLVPACKLCHRQHHLLWLSAYSHADIGAIPSNSISQTQLNTLQRTCFVLDKHENIEYRNKYGMGEFGEIFNTFVEKLQRPKPYHLLSLEKKNLMTYQHISTITTPEVKDFIDKLKVGEVSLGNVPDLIKADVNKVLKDAEILAQDNHKNADNRFNLFEMAMALKDAPTEFIHSFKPQNIRLIFNPSILSSEEIEHYQKRALFDPKTWPKFNYDNL